MADEVTTALDGIRQRAEVTERAGYRIGEDACLLLSVVDEVLKLHQRQETPCRSYDMDLRCAAHSGPVTDWTAEGTKTLRESIRDCPDCTYRERHPCEHCRCEDWPCPTVEAVSRALLSKEGE